LIIRISFKHEKIPTYTRVYHLSIIYVLNNSYNFFDLNILSKKNKDS